MSFDRNGDHRKRNRLEMTTTVKNKTRIGALLKGEELFGIRELSTWLQTCPPEPRSSTPEPSNYRRGSTAAIIPGDGTQYGAASSSSERSPQRLPHCRIVAGFQICSERLSATYKPPAQPHAPFDFDNHHAMSPPYAKSEKMATRTRKAKVSLLDDRINILDQDAVKAISAKQVFGTVSATLALIRVSAPILRPPVVSR